MATIGSTYLDLVEMYKRMDGMEGHATIIEMLNDTNAILDDAIAVECNLGTRHRHTVRTGLPDVTWGRLYRGIPQSKSRTAQVEDVTGFVEGLSTIDMRLLDISATPDALRLGEAQSYLEAMSQEAASKLFYGSDAVNAEEFMGLAPRFDDPSAPNGMQIIDGGGTGNDNTSIWMIGWGDSQCQLLYPKGTMAGVDRKDMGEQRVTDADGNAYYAKEELFRWHLGLAVRDWRYVVRIANVDVSDIAAGTVDLYGLMRKGYYQMQQRRIPGGSISIACNTDILEALDGLATNAGTTDNFVRLKPMEIQGKEVQTYRGIPLRETDALINTEARVVFP